MKLIKLKKTAMKLLILLTVLMGGILTVQAQTPQTQPDAAHSPTPQSVDCRVDVTHPKCAKVVTTQGYIDDATKAFELVKAQSEAITTLLRERSLRVDERKAWESVKASYDDLLAINVRTQDAYEKLVLVQQKIINMYADLTEKLQTQLGKKKGFFDKVLDAVKTIGYILAGVALGRGL